MLSTVLLDTDPNQNSSNTLYPYIDRIPLDLILLLFQRAGKRIPVISPLTLPLYLSLRLTLIGRRRRNVTRWSPPGIDRQALPGQLHDPLPDPLEPLPRRVQLPLDGPGLFFQPMQVGEGLREDFSELEMRDLESFGGLLDLVVHGHVGKDVVEKDVSHRAGRIAKVSSFISLEQFASLGPDHARTVDSRSRNLEIAQVPDQGL